MNSVRFAKAYYIGAFVLGALIALIVASSARSAEPFRGDHFTIEAVEFPGALQRSSY